MMRPRLYVVDEPLANLDPATAARLLAILRRLADDGDAVVIVEHRVEEALVLRPDRVLYLDDGAIALPRRPSMASSRSPTRTRSSCRSRSSSSGSAREPWPMARIEPRPQAARHRPPAPSRRRPPSRRPPPRLEFRDVRAGYRRPRDPPRHRRAPRPRRDRRRPRPERLGQDDAVPDGDAPARHRRRARSSSTACRIGGPHGRAARDRLRLRLPEPQPDAVREDRPGGAPVRARGTSGVDPETFDGLVADCLRRTSLDTLEDIRRRPPLTLSFGQQKRLALAIALALQPTTLILDEPSAGQDHRTSTAFMREVLADPRTRSLYLITHDVDLALTHADRILLFRDGRVVADGPPDEVIEDEDRWTACNLRPTSLMLANARWRWPSEGFLDAEALARRIVAARRRRAGSVRKEVRRRRFD